MQNLQGGEKTARLQQYYLVSGKSHEIGDLLRHNDVNLAKIRHVFGDTFLTDEMREHDLQYGKPFQPKGGRV